MTYYNVNNVNIKLKEKIKMSIRKRTNKYSRKNNAYILQAIDFIQEEKYKQGKLKGDIDYLESLDKITPSRNTFDLFQEKPD